VFIGVALPTVVAVAALYLSGKVREAVHAGLAAMVSEHDPKKA
jgi:hypothetical protein